MTSYAEPLRRGARAVRPRAVFGPRALVGSCGSRIPPGDREPGEAC